MKKKESQHKIKLKLNLQVISTSYATPVLKIMKTWVKAALNAAINYGQKIKSAEITIRIVDELEMQELNKTYRNKDKPTNVLSFPTTLARELKLDYLGDIIICASIVHKEAAVKNKTLDEHWAHLVIHSILHLLGFDHETAEDATLMEQLETEILLQLGFRAPYGVLS